MGVDEILVHLSGPTSKKDDNRLRAMAAAYNTFQPVSRLDVHNHSGVTASESNAVAHEAVNGNTHAAPASSTVSQTSSTQVPRTALKQHGTMQQEDHIDNGPATGYHCTYIESTPLAAAAVQSQLFYPSFGESPDTASSPLAEYDSKRRQISPPSDLPQEYFHSARAVSEVSGERPRERGLEETNTQNHDSSPIHYVSSTEAEREAQTPTVIESLPKPQIPSMDGPHPSDDVKAATPVNGKITITSHLMSSQDQFVEAQEVIRSPARSVSPKARDGPAPSARSLAASAASLPVVAKVKTHNVDKQPARRLFSAEIHPPLPPTGLLPDPAAARSDPTSTTSIVTRSLAEIMTNPHLVDRFKPKGLSRPIRPMERGHWRVDTRSWNNDDKGLIDFWRFLKGFIEKGRAGWGIWVCGDVGDQQTISSDEGHDNEQEARNLGIFRVYCFGGVVEHIYLLLFLASKSRVKKCGVEWLDAAGEVVVTMH